MHVHTAAPAGAPVQPGVGLEGGTSSLHRMGATGRVMVVDLNARSRKRSECKSMLRQIAKATGLGSSSATVCATSDYGCDGIGDEAESSEVVLLENLGIALLNGDADQNRAAAGMQSEGSDSGLIVEPECMNETLGMRVTPSLQSRGVAPDQDFAANGGMPADLATQRLAQLQVEGLNPASLGSELGATADQCFQDTPESTYGLKMTNAVNSSLAGNGIRVAVLDSGMDLGHSDFSGRSITHKVFVPPNQPDNGIHDINGHGTHCIGTACGPVESFFGPRYGIAHAAEIFVGKVLAHNFITGRAGGGDFGILRGIDWAIENRCHIISMSLGAPVSEPNYPPRYEAAGASALSVGSLIIAATGNDSFRPGFIAPVGRPANCPSIAGVAGIDSCFRVYRRSNGRQFVHNGAEVNFTGPGVNVFSSVPRHQGNTGYMSGTSMATPHVSGIAALVAEQTGLGGLELYAAVKARCHDLGHFNTFGFGLARI